jgi:flagellar brake protein
MSTSPTPERLPGPSSPYWIRYALEVRQYFADMAKQRERVQLWFGGQDFLVSMVLAVGPRGEIILDVGADPKSNQKLLKTGTALLVARHEGVELKAELTGLQLTTHDALPAFVCPTPAQLHRLQRREFHRMPIPAGQRAHCRLPVAAPESAEPPSPPVQWVNADITDLSLGGIGLMEPAAPGLRLQVGDRLEGCPIDLGEHGTLKADLNVRHVTELPSRRGLPRRKVGLRFLQLSPGAEQAIQRYLFQLELDHRALNA